MKIRKKIGDLGKEQIQQLVQDFLDELGEGAVALLEHFEESDNPEFLEVEVDEEQKILSFTRKDGSHYIYNLSSETIDDISERLSVVEQREGIDNFENISDVENRCEITKDNYNKILSYREHDGTLVENAGIKTPSIQSQSIKGNIHASSIELSEEAKDDIINILPKNIGLYKSPNIPNYGVTNIKTEIFYLTADSRVHSINDVVLFQDYADTVFNANNRMTICHYYVKETLTVNPDGSYSINENSVRLTHYASGKVSKNTQDNKFYAQDPIRRIDNTCYYADSLGYIEQAGRFDYRRRPIEGYSRVAPWDSFLANYAAKNALVEVVEIVGPCCVDAWTVEDWDWFEQAGTDIGLKIEHKCIADIDFGHYFSKTNVAVGVKHQGSSTQRQRKRNFRYTFYKNNQYKKKDKVKIGEMLRLSGYNLKANATDNTRIKELILYRLFTQLWQSRPITDRYDWDNKVNGLYHGATGNIQGFPIKLMVNGDFYGIYTFALKKDEKNYMMSGEDEDGFLLSGAGADANGWGAESPDYDVTSHFDEEMLDETSESTINAVQHWIEFIQGRLFYGSNGHDYRCQSLTFFTNAEIQQEQQGHTYQEVKFEDGKMYLIDGDVKLDHAYRTTTLVDGKPVESSIEATLIPFDKETACDRLDVLGFIDYFICIQTFLMPDNTMNNVMLYSGPEKKKFRTFFYDLDGAIASGKGVTADILAPGVSLCLDMSLWQNVHDLYWDEIVNRYCDLRKSVLSIDYIKSIYNDIKNNIPEIDYDNESSKWGISARAENFDIHIAFLEERLEYLDNEYFII